MSLSIIRDIVNETHKHPLFSLILVLTVFGFAGYATKNHAEKTEVQALKEKVTEDVASLDKKITDLKTLIEKGNIEQKLNSTESEIFQLERIANTSEATSRDLSRLSKLKIEYGNLERRLKAYH